MLALLYDIHGNDVAFEAVVEHATAAGADAWLLGGDYCLMGAQPAAVLDRIETLPPDTVRLRGNTERWVAHPEADDIPLEEIRDAALWTAGAIGPDAVHEMATWPDCVHHVPFDGAGVTVFCHASPASDMIGFTDSPADTDGDAAANEYEANTIVCGHTHIQFIREVGVIQVVNPGSVGMPFDGDQRAAYGLLSPDGSFELLRVEYNVERAIAQLDGIDAPWAEISRRRLREARI